MRINKVTSCTMANGSFGIYKRGNHSGEQLITVWFCGMGRERQTCNVNDVCAHRTRAEARECRRAQETAQEAL